MRPIDAEALFEFLTEQLEKETGMYSKGRNAGLNIARSALHDKTITPTIAPPPNQPLTDSRPLTLEELREMDREPVYVKQLGKQLFFHDGWMLVTEYGAIDRTQSMVFCEYGKTWLAYRRRPEEASK